MNTNFILFVLKLLALILVSSLMGYNIRVVDENKQKFLNSLDNKAFRAYKEYKKTLVGD